MAARPAPPQAGFETLAEIILSLKMGSLLSDAAILRVPEEGPSGPVSKGAANYALFEMELE